MIVVLKGYPKSPERLSYMFMFDTSLPRMLDGASPRPHIGSPYPSGPHTLLLPIHYSARSILLLLPNDIWVRQNGERYERKALTPRTDILSEELSEGAALSTRNLGPKPRERGCLSKD